MFLKNKTDWSLLAKYLAGEANENENQTVTDWMNSKPGNRALFNKIKSDWMIMDKMNTRFSVDDGWNKLRNRIIAGEEPVLIEKNIISQKMSNKYMTPMRIAATILLLAVIGVSLVFITGRMQKIIVSTSYAEKGKKIALPDGSVVYLNAGTTFSYPKNLGKKSREVRLDGEAFFEVSPDKNNPFIIYANNAQVKVLGTSFNVDAKEDKDHVEVYVNTGMVELSEISDQSNLVLLHPGNIGLLDHKAIRMMTPGNENCIAWKTGDLIFRETRLKDVTSLLNEVYNVNIVIREPGIDTTLVDGSYQDEPLEQILDVICTQNHLTIAKSEDTIYLSR